MELNRDQIIKALECFRHRILNSKLAEQVYEEDMMSIINALALIKELTEENKTLLIKFQAMKGAANSYKTHCEKLSEEIFNAFERGQNQAKADTVRTMQEKIKEKLDISVCGYSTEEVVSDVFDTIDRIAEEMLESKCE